MRLAACFFLISINLFVSNAIGDEINLTVVPAEAQTASTTPMTFVLEESTMRAGALRFWGEVKNETNQTFRFVRVIATAKTVGGRILGRTEAFVEPDTIGPGMSGHVNAARIPCDGTTPEKLEYSVMGNAVR